MLYSPVYLPTRNGTRLVAPRNHSVFLIPTANRCQAIGYSYRTSIAYHLLASAHFCTGSSPTEYTYLSLKAVSTSIIVNIYLGSTLIQHILDYLETEGLTGIADRFGVSEGSLISLGYSPSALLMLFISCAVALCLPVLFGLRKLKGDMVAGGTNSLVMSAACHVLPRARMAAQRNWNGEGEIGNMLFETESEATTSTDSLRKLTEGKLRWGAVSVSRELAERTPIEREQQVPHLRFGDDKDEIHAPEDGHYYM